jgi:hypothetical protein
MTSDITSREGQGRAVDVPVIDLSSVITRTLEAVREDPAQLRNAIYELARVKLQKDAWANNMSILAARRLMLALETAIERVETVASQQDELARAGSTGRLIADARSELYYPLPDGRADAEPVAPAALLDMRRDEPATPPHRDASGVPWWRSGHTALLLRVGAVCLLAIGGIFLFSKQSALFEKTPSAVSAAPAKKADLKAAAPEAPSLPEISTKSLRPAGPAQLLPAVYGVYAVSKGQLFELEPLRGRVPDARVHMSAPIGTPSHALLPDGRLEFIVYRRDIASSAPDRVQVRVIAKIMRAMAFSKAGQTNIAPVEDQWTIRGNAYEMRVAPVSENAEMLMMRPENPEFVFPAGRYGLVLKDLAYDFSVSGPITDAAQCLERTEAANGGFYSECRSPSPR